jgi:hypothetical protein
VQKELIFKRLGSQNTYIMKQKQFMQKSELPRLKTIDNRRASLDLTVSKNALNTISNIAAQPPTLDRNERFKSLMEFDVQ